MNTKYKITIAICTYNRSFYLDKCLESLYVFGANKKEIEILVVNNNSYDNTEEVTYKYYPKLENLKYIKENKIGLSYARNRAIFESKAQFIAFIDDDVKISESYVKRLLWLVNNIDFDCLGGMYYAWYIKEKPKWLPKSFGSKPRLLNSLDILKDEYNSGGNIIFKKETLEIIGGFPLFLGMKGKKIFYGEEDFVQKKIRENGGQIFFDPDLYVYHVVQEYKLSIKWQLKSIYLNSKSNYLINKNEKFGQIIFEIIKSFISILIKRLPNNLSLMLIKKNYYIQNVIIDTFKPFIINIGKLSGKIYLLRSRIHYPSLLNEK